MKSIESKNAKGTLIIGFLLSTLLFGYIKNSGYGPSDSSFYCNLSLFPYLILCIGVVFLLLNKVNSQISKDKGGVIYFICIYYLMYNLILISLFWNLKYGLIFGSDSWLHLFEINNVMSSSYLDIDSNFYPATVFYICIFSMITSILPVSMYTYVIPIQYMICGLLIFIFIKKISTIYDITLPIGTIFLIILINPIFMAQPHLAPWTFSFLFLILYGYLFMMCYNNNMLEYNILLVIVIATLIITHVLAAIFVLFSVILMYILFHMSNHFLTRSSINLNHIILVTVLLLSWIIIVTGFLDHQLAHVLQKLPDIIFGGSITAQQTTITNKSFTDLLLGKSNIISNTVLVLISMMFIFSEIIKQKINSKFNTILPLYMSYIFAGFGLYFLSQFVLGKTDYSAIQIRFFYFASIIFPIFIFYGYAKSVKYINVHAISTILLIIFLISSMTIYERPELGEFTSLITTSTYSGIDWGNDNIISETTKVITGADYITQYMVYKAGGYGIYSSMRGSTNSLLIYFGYDVNTYKHRQYEEKVSFKNINNSYLYYYPLMDHYVAYSKKDNSIIGINYQLIKEKKNDKIYNSDGLIIFKLNEAWNKNLSTL